jgi:type III secretory pathway component EscR
MMAISRPAFTFSASQGKRESRAGVARARYLWLSLMVVAVIVTMIVIAMFVTMISAMLLTVAWCVYVVVPVISHEEDRAATGDILAAIPAPVLCMRGGHVQI